MNLFSRSIKTQLKEMNTRTWLSGLRNNANALKGSFLSSPTTSVLRDTRVDYDKARKLYYNTDANCSNGSFFSKPIVDGIADHIGLPIISMQDEAIDEIVNDWIENHWQMKLWEMYRNALRDTRTWVRLRQPFPGPLVANDEEDDVTLEILDAEAVTSYYDPVTNELIRVEIVSERWIEDARVSIRKLAQTQSTYVPGRMHTIVEIITPENYMYYDKTDQVFLDQYTTLNKWNFVPLVEVFNDFDSALNGGTSELENPYPFFQAFHDLMIQTRGSHGYHADPKIKFKLNDVMTFLRNNFPDAFNEAGEFVGQVSWKGNDIYFMESEEDVGFIEANLQTNDSVALMEFVIDCICIAAEVTEAVLFRAKSGATGETDELFRFKTKIKRKRSNFAEYIQQIVKMALKISTGNVTKIPAISWMPMQTGDLVAEGTAMNQIITATEVANRAGAISIQTYRAKVRPFFPHMKDNQKEDTQVKADQAAEQQRQLDFEKKMQALKPKPAPAPVIPSHFSGGPNGAGKGSKLPIDIIPTSKGN